MSHPTKSNIPLILALWLAGLGAAAQFGKIAVAMPALRETYAVSEVALGFLMSSLGMVGLLFGVVGGVVVDRLGLRKMLLLGLIAGGCLSLVEGFMPAYPVMIALRFIEGFAHLVIVIAAPVLVASSASDRLRPAAMALWSSFFGVAYMAIALVAPPLIDGFGVGGLIRAHGLYLFVIAGILVLMLPKGPRTRPVAKAMSLSDWVGVHRRIYSSPYLSASGLGFVWYAMMYVALLTYLPDFVSAAQRSWMSAVMPLSSIAVSLTFGIFLLQRVSSIRVVKLGFAFSGLTALGLLVTVGNEGQFMIAAIVMMALAGIIASGSFASLAELNSDPQDRAHATGALAQMGNVGTTTGAPILAALIGGFGIWGLVCFVVLLSLLGICIHTVLGARRRELPIT
ncbi:MFS transporter [Actibacterium lipolyticum]|uniref:Major Facilitator Superfamily protein n=1 Tax=Actibacterium lipolyticum TaxID=1524263 RepID=A0A238KJ37_9RHOB|nr:MFS transporter [Actibacterium lipolyticum]SMX42730.1 Major Facilitator Superfamily protein [Actibacterium lipolyticum]